MIDVYVWAQTTYETNHCRGCDARLRKSNGQPKRSSVVFEKRYDDNMNDAIYMFCKKCGRCCGEYRQVRRLEQAMQMKDKEGWKQ